MALPPAIPKREKRTERWKSQAHLKFVRSRACSVCGSTVNVEAAHVRLGSNAGIGRKPDDIPFNLQLDRQVREHTARPLRIRSAPQNLRALARLTSLSSVLEWE